jgi:opacity protein-like surface antigen
MKKILLTSFAALMFTASADAGFYIGGYARTGDMVGEFFDVIALDATVGYRFNNGLRLEADVLSIMMEPGFGDFEIGAGMVRALYDIKVNDKFVPYVGIGVAPMGMGTGWDGMTEEISFNGSLVAGISFNIDKSVALDLQYSRLIAFGVGDGSWDTGANEVRAGLRYAF